MDSLRNCGSKANNIRAVIITALYNAVMTTSSYYTNLFAYHSANPQSIRGVTQSNKVKGAEDITGLTQLALAEKVRDQLTDLSED